MKDFRIYSFRWVCPAPCKHAITTTIKSFWCLESGLTSKIICSLFISPKIFWRNPNSLFLSLLVFFLISDSSHPILAAAKYQKVYFFLPWTANTHLKWYFYISLCMWFFSFHGRASISHSSAPPTTSRRLHRVVSSRPVTSSIGNGHWASSVLKHIKCVTKSNFLA